MAWIRRYGTIQAAVALSSWTGFWTGSWTAMRRGWAIWIGGEPRLWRWPHKRAHGAHHTQILLGVYRSPNATDNGHDE